MGLLYTVLVTLLWPLVALGVVAHPRLRGGWRERLWPAPAQVEPGAVWIHAASLGEGRAAEGLIRALRADRPDAQVIRTCTSDVARAQRIGADQTSFLPIDVPWLLVRWLDRYRPRVLILVEADVWPGVLLACARRGVPVVVAGARVGPGTRRLLSVWSGLRRLARWLPTDEAAAVVLGGAPIGELKLDAPAPASPVSWTHPVAVVAGSTHAGDEDAVLDAVGALASGGLARPLVVLAPRDPRRFDAVAARLAARGEAWVRRSRLVDGVVPREADVLLLDSIGELAGLYARAAAAFVGGTFDPSVGGHSPAEPAAAAVPVVHGPFTQGGVWRTLRTFPALTPGELADALGEALRAPRDVRPPGGAAAAVIAAVRAELDAAAPPERPLRPWLWPLAALWRVAAAGRRRAATKAGIPVIVVGAITAGGSGKTPVSAWLAQALRDASPAVVSRGYGRRAGADVRTSGNAADLGDELCMLARRGVNVVSAPDRVAGVAAAQQAGARIAILDDALQRPSLVADLTIVVVDARWPTGGGTIPVGTGRLALTTLREADVVWVNHGSLPPALAPYVRADAIVVEARYRAVAWVRRGDWLPLDALAGRKVLAFSGVARPEGFLRLARALGVVLESTMLFADHYAYTWADLQAIEAWLDDHAAITTEKDAARLPADAGVHALLVEPALVRGEAELRARLTRLVTG